MTLRVLVALLLVVASAGRAQAQAETANAPAQGFVNLNFDQVDVRLLVKLVSDLTGRRFVVDDRVAGKVTVVTPGRVATSEVYPLFLSILESHGFIVVDRGGIVHVQRRPDGAMTGAPVVGAEEGEGAGGLVTRVVRVKHISAVELKRLLEPLVQGGKEGAVSAFGPTNHLLITDTTEHIREIMKIVLELDQPGAARMVEVIPLKHASAEPLAKQILAAVTASTSAGERVSRHLQQVGEGASALPTSMVIVASPQANSVIVVGTPVDIGEVKRMIEMMDVPSPSGYGRLNAVFLKYLTVEEAAKTLNALLAKTAEKDARQPIAIEPNVANNALIIDASPQDFEHVRKLVEELDRIPQQVMVEVLIAEVGLGKNLDFGVQFSTIEEVKEGSTTFIGRSRPEERDSVAEILENGIFPQGLSVGVAEGTILDATGNLIQNIPVAMHALAQNRDVKVLATIPLVVQNNMEATASVVENIPILRSTIEGGSGTARDVIQNIDRIDVGIKLKFTPHVNPDGKIQLALNPSIEAIIDEGPPETPFAPTIAKREVSTTVTVPDRATVIITGLMREDEIDEISKVPLLGDIPVLGWLFRSQQKRRQQTNLLIFVTPHIVTDLSEAMERRADLEERTGLSATSSVPQRAVSGGR
jgi:general secretion pathway protein D